MIFAVLSTVLDILEESHRDFMRLRRKRKLKEESLLPGSCCILWLFLNQVICGSGTPLA